MQGPIDAIDENDYWFKSTQVFVYVKVNKTIFMPLSFPVIPQVAFVMHLLQALLVLLSQAITAFCLVIDTASTDMLNSPTLNHPSLEITQPSVEYDYVVAPSNDSQHLNLTKEHIPCQAASPPLRPADPTACTYAATIACRLLSQTSFPRIVKGKWVWSNVSGCSAAFYFPPEGTSSLIPDLGGCKETFGDIARNCARRPRENVGSINVRTLPRWRDTGSAFDEGTVRYLVASMEIGK